MDEFWDTRTELNEDELFINQTELKDKFWDTWNKLYEDKFIDSQIELEKDEFWDAKTDNEIYGEEAIEKDNDNISPSIIIKNSRLSKETSKLANETSNSAKETNRKLEIYNQEHYNK